MRISPTDLRIYTKNLLAADPALSTELKKIHNRRRRPRWLADANSALSDMTTDRSQPSSEAAAPSLDLESIVQRVGRPVLAIEEGNARINIQDPESAVWADRIKSSAALLHPAISAVGRIDVGNFPLGLPYVGTGWLVDSDVVVTNRHVALEFAERGSSTITFQVGFNQNQPISVAVDFLEEIDNSAKLVFDIADVLYIAPDQAADVAFLRLARTNGQNAPKPLSLSATVATAKTVVAAVGYPARDPRVQDQSLMAKLFGNVFDKKRLSPGFITGMEAAALTHDCTTLGGSSGSALISFQSGEALALHFAGVFLKNNYAVPAPTITTLLKQVRESVLLAPSGADVNEDSTNTTMKQGGTMASQQATFVIPLQITVSIGAPSGGPSDSGTIGPTVAISQPAYNAIPITSNPPRPQVEAAVVAARAQLAKRQDVVSIESGFKFTDGWITDQRCVVIAVKAKYSETTLQAMGLTSLPSAINGVPTDVAVATVADAESAQMLDSLEAAQRAIVCNYKPPANLSLDEVNDKMALIVHASPDAGWPVLEGFLGRVRTQLTVGMFEFTAPHIVESCQTAIKPAGRRLSLVLQNRDEAKKGTTADDFTEEETVDKLKSAAGRRLSFSWASVSGPDRLFNTSYHIKVAVRDESEMWLSSGSWRSSNQPPFDPIADGDQKPPLIQQYDRDWHVVAKHDGLSELFDKFLTYDRTEASSLQTEAVAGIEPFLWIPEEYLRATSSEARVAPQYQPPLSVNRMLRVQPLLTPDNYAKFVVPLIKSAKKSVYFQNQSLDAVQSDEGDDVYQQLLNALLDKQQQQGIDVKIIFRRFPNMRDTLTKLKDYGFDTSQQLIRPMTNCHTKGIIIDGETVLVGSHNWTRSGTQYNRDASLIIYDQEIAQYFQALFTYDWARIAGNVVDESLPAMEFVRADEGVIPPGTVRISLAELLGA